MKVFTYNINKLDKKVKIFYVLYLCNYKSTIFATSTTTKNANNMTTSTIYKTKKVNSINTITCEIEETFMNNFSILIYDEESEVWIEKFADTYEDAKNIADKLIIKVCNQY